jgi:hypothetical protein
LTAAAVETINGVTPGDEIAFLVRPDGHLGLAADDRFARRLDDYLRRLCAG